MFIVNIMVNEEDFEYQFDNRYDAIRKLAEEGAKAITENEEWLRELSGSTDPNDLAADKDYRGGGCGINWYFSIGGEKLEDNRFCGIDDSSFSMFTFADGYIEESE